MNEFMGQASVPDEGQISKDRVNTGTDKTALVFCLICWDWESGGMSWEAGNDICTTAGIMFMYMITMI